MTVEEFHCLGPACETAVHPRRATGRRDGNPRTVRRLTVDTPCPLPPPEDRLLFIWVDLKTSALQVVQGRWFGRGQSKANQGIHVLLPVRRAALEALGEVPTRTLAVLGQRLGVAAETAAALLTRTESAPSSPSAPSAGGTLALRLPTMGANGRSSAPKIRLSNRAVIAARTSAIP